MVDMLVGTRVEVLRGKLEGRHGTVIDKDGAGFEGCILVSEDGPDDVDDWVSPDDVRPLGDWVLPPQQPCYATAKPAPIPGAPHAR